MDAVPTAIVLFNRYEAITQNRAGTSSSFQEKDFRGEECTTVLILSYKLRRISCLEADG